MQQELERRLGKSVVGLKVIEDEKRIIIRGQAQTFYQKQVAQSLVMRHSQGREIVNEIFVGRRKGAKTQVQVPGGT